MTGVRLPPSYPNKTLNQQKFQSLTKFFFKNNNRLNLLVNHQDSKFLYLLILKIIANLYVVNIFLKSCMID
jgi:hypothetical protein